MEQQAHGQVLVVGFGIAGALVSWFLEKHNINFVVVDDAAAGSSSPVAAGLINPLAGRKLVLAHELARFLPFARETYQQLGQFLGQSFWSEREFWTLLRDEEERQTWQIRAKDPSVHRYLEEADLALAVPEHALAEAGVARVRGGGQVAFAPLLQAFSSWLADRGRYRREPFDHTGLLPAHRVSSGPGTGGGAGARAGAGAGSGAGAGAGGGARGGAGAGAGTGSGGWTYRDTGYCAVLFCEGYRVRFNPWFAHLPWRINRGQRMLVNIPGLMATSDRNAAVWRKQALLAPLGQDCYWLGSVNDWDLDDATPTAHAQATLMAQLHSLTDQPSQWLETKAGIRPVLRDRRPAVGFHPEHASLGLLNGLGTKGALLGPWFASALVDGLRSLFGWTDGGTAPESLEPGSAALWASVNPARFDG